MPAVVTKADTVACGHSGKVVTVGAPKLTVAGQPVLLEAGVLQLIGGCMTPATTSPVSVKCTKVDSVINPPSLATKLNVSGAPVVLATLTGTTNGEVAGVKPQPLLPTTVAQTKLTTV